MICNDTDVNISEMGIKTCHKVPISRISANVGKKVIIKFINHKHAESIPHINKLY